MNVPHLVVILKGGLRALEKGVCHYGLCENQGQSGSRMVGLLLNGWQIGQIV